MYERTKKDRFHKKTVKCNSRFKPSCPVSHLKKGGDAYFDYKRIKYSIR